MANTNLKISTDEIQLRRVANNVSVVIPLYNKLNYIEACIDSVLQQTILPGRIIIIDDGSNDGSPELVAEKYNEKVTLIKQGNEGASSARNKGIEASDSGLIAFLDADDQWDNNYLEEICRLVIDFPECDVFAAAYRLVCPHCSTNVEYVGLNTGFRGEIHNYFSHSMREWSLLSSSSTVVRKSELLRAGKFNPELRLGEDIDMWCRLALNAKIAFYNQPLASYYCFNDSSITRIYTLESELEYSKNLSKLLQENKIPVEMIDDVKRFIAKGLQILVQEFAKNGRYSKIAAMITDRRLYYYFGQNTIKMLIAMILPRFLYDTLKDSIYPKIKL